MKKEVLAIIPARGGSKGIPNKNIIDVCGKALIAYSIEAAKKSSFITRVIVSTDSEKIADVAKLHAAEIPFLRPKHLAEDSTPAFPVIEHLLSELAKENYDLEIVIYLQPTSALRTNKHIDEALKQHISSQSETTVSVVKIPHNLTPSSAMTQRDGVLHPYLQEDQNNLLRRQDKPELYARNGPAILIMNTEALLQRKALYGENTSPFVMNKIDSVDIDDAEDLHIVRALLNMQTPTL